MENFVVYKSSAGSGKTFTLVKEYLRLSLADPLKLHYNFKRILAVTFTNKAAAEMKSRVITALQKIAENAPDNTLADVLCRDLGITQTELRKRANIVLTQILHHYSDFSIGTIDSFTHKMVKTFAHDLKLPVNFNVELDVNGFYEHVVAELFSKIGEDPYISKLLKEYVLLKAEDNASWDPEQLILDFSQLIHKENSVEHIDALKKLDIAQLERVRAQIKKIRTDYYAFLGAEADKALALISKYNLSDQDFKGKSRGPQTFFYKARDKNIKPEDAGQKSLNDAITQNKWVNNNHQTEVNEKFTALALGLKKYMLEHYPLVSLCQLIDKQLTPLLLLKKIDEISLNKKNEEHLVFITEFNNNIFEIINNEPTPFIYERLGEKYRHFLLDEFQDTSSLQWHNMLPLIDNSLANGWYNLVVGDGKQSIYRWRNANVKQFTELPVVRFASGNAVVSERAQNLLRNYKEQLLYSNYRSLKNVVKFNNSIFAVLGKKYLDASNIEIYKQVEQIAVKDEGGYISIEHGIFERDELDENNFKSIKWHIQSALDSGFNLKDICILSRTNNQGNAVAQFLTRENVPVVSSESLLLKNNLEIGVLTAFLKYQANPEDMISAAVIVNYLFQTQFITEEIFHKALLQLSQKFSLYKVLTNCDLKIGPEDFLLNNLFDSCISIINLLKLDKNGHLYLRFFLDEVNEFLVKENSNIISFLSWWEKRSEKASLIIPQDTNAVKIMTIHSSKGLEFPVVILPYCNWTVFNAREDWVNIQSEKIDLPVAIVKLNDQAAVSGLEEQLESEKQEQLLDNLNLLYVAFTRAIERLHIITYTTTRKSKGTVSEWVGNYASENMTASNPNLFESGTLHKKIIHEKKPETTAYLLDSLHFNATGSQVEIKSAYRHGDQDSENARKHGLLLHWLLSQLKSYQDVDQAISKAMLSGFFGEAESGEYKSKLLEIVEEPLLKKYFTPANNSRIESEFVLASGEVLRPDRILFFPNETVLIDYKTGMENDNKYKKQLQKYESALLELGYTNIRKLLVYIDNLKIVELN